MLVVNSNIQFKFFFFCLIGEDNAYSREWKPVELKQKVFQ